MLKKILSIKSTKALSKNEQKSVKGGIIPIFGDCCTCVFRPRNSMFPIIITQSCATPCPTDGSLEYEETGC